MDKLRDYPENLGPGKHHLGDDLDVVIGYGGSLLYHSDCQQCVYANAHGGPSHYASPRCRSGKRPHCTCDTCF